MNVREPIRQFQRWTNQSLANTFALRAALIAIASSLMVALISLIVIYRVESTILTDHLHEKSRRVAEKIEATIDIVENSAADLSKNPMFMTALLDSPGRQTYVVPFLQNYKFPVAAANGLALCDINGELMAAMRSPLSTCGADASLIKQVVADGKTLRKLVPQKNGHMVWTLYQGIIFAYTGTVEGVLVVQLDLNDVLLPIADDLDLDTVAMAHAGSSENIAGARTSRQPTGTPELARTQLFKEKPGAVPIPLDAVAGEHLPFFGGKLLPLAAGYALGSLLLVTGVMYWARRTSRFIVAPLSELTDIANRIARSGDLTITVPHSKTGEVAQLSRSFEIMVTTLRHSEATLEEKVAQRTEELRKSESAAEAANQAKSAFLANMSHEIRTPMNGVLGMAQMLLMPNLGESERRDYARTILVSGQTLLTLLNDILDLSKVEAGKLKLESAPFEPEQVIHEIRTLFSGSAEQKQLAIESIWSGPPRQHYLGDVFRLRQMLSNLTSNAIKFTERGGIHIEARELEREAGFAVLEFSVSDSGIGIPADKQSLLFQPFSQTDTSTTRHYGGTGLGLSIVSNMARLMNGEVGVESEVGQGSRFWFRIHAGLLETDTDSRQSTRPEPRPDDKPTRMADREETLPTMDITQLLTLAEKMTPLLEQNKFDAFVHFNELMALATGTDMEAEIAGIGTALHEFRYDLALERLHQAVAARMPKDST